MRSYLFCTSNDTLDPTATEYNLFNARHAVAWTATETLRHQMNALDGIIREWYIELSAAPGAGTQYSLEIMQDGVASGYAVVIDGTNTNGINYGTLAISAGQQLSVRCTPTSTPTARSARWYVVIEAATFGEIPLMGGSNILIGQVTAVNSFLPGGDAYGATVGLGKETVVPFSGTVKNLYTDLDGTPGAGADYTFTVQKNGSNTTLQTVNTTGSVFSDLTHSFTVVAGDKLRMRIAPSGVPTNRRGVWGVVFVSDIQWQTPILGASDNPMGVAAQQFNNQVNSAWDTTETTKAVPTPNMRIRNLYVEIFALILAGNRDFKLLKNGADQALAVNFTTADLTKNNQTNVVEYAKGDNFSFTTIPNSETDPANETAGWGFALDSYVPGLNSLASMGAGI